MKLDCRIARKKTYKRMIAALAKLMDWSAFQAVALMMPSDFMQPPRLEEALEFLKGPEFTPDESRPARVEFDPDESGMDFRLPSPRPGNCAENNVVYGRLCRCGERWQERAVVILLHGSGDSLNYDFRFPLIARRGNRAGFNAVTLVAPYHSKEDMEDLWQSWGQPDIWRLPHGHVGVCCGFVPDLPGRLLRWLSPRLNAPTA
jgi:hypothetical protein